MKLYKVGLNLHIGKGKKACELEEYFNIVAPNAENAILGAIQHACKEYTDVGLTELLEVIESTSIDLVY